MPLQEISKIPWDDLILEAYQAGSSACLADLARKARQLAETEEVEKAKEILDEIQQKMEVALCLASGGRFRSASALRGALDKAESQEEAKESCGMPDQQSVQALLELCWCVQQVRSSLIGAQVVELQTAADSAAEALDLVVSETGKGIAVGNGSQRTADLQEEYDSDDWEGAPVKKKPWRLPSVLEEKGRRCRKGVDSGDNAFSRTLSGLMASPASPEEIFRGIAQAAVQCREEFNNVTLAQCLYTLAQRCNLMSGDSRVQDLVGRLAKRIPTVLPQFKNQELCNVLYALTMFNYRDEELVSQLAAVVEQHRSHGDFGVRDIAIAGWALVKLGYKDQKLAVEMFQEAKRHAAECTPLNIGSILSALEEVEDRDMTVVYAFFNEALRKVDQFRPKTVCNVLHSAAAMGYRNTAFNEAFFNAVKSQIALLDPKDIANALYAAAVLGCRDKELLAELFSAAGNQAKQFISPNSIVVVLWSAAATGCRDDRALADLFSEAERKYKEFDAGQLSSVLWTAAVFGVAKEDFFPRIIGAARDFLRNADGGNLAVSCVTRLYHIHLATGLLPEAESVFRRYEGRILDEQDRTKSTVERELFGVVSRVLQGTQWVAVDGCGEHGFQFDIAVMRETKGDKGENITEKVNVEIDGRQHEDEHLVDAFRDGILRKLGWRAVVRISYRDTNPLLGNPQALDAMVRRKLREAGVV